MIDSIRNKTKHYLKGNIWSIPHYRIISSIKSYLIFIKSIFLSKFNYIIDPVEFFTSKSCKLIYIVNSKVACSSIKKSLMEFDNNTVNDSNYKDIHHLSKELGYRSYKLPPDCENYEFFSVVRNPFERLVSLYVNKFEDSKKISRVGFDFDTYLGGVFNQSDSFDVFIEKVCTIPDTLADRHFKSQYFLINEEVGNKIKVYKFENLQELSDFFVNREIPSLGHANKSKKYNYMDYYTTETANKVAKRYSKDIQFYGYEQEFNHLMNYLNKNQ